MKLAVLSDIHGNLEAFNAVLEDIGKTEAEEILCLGDVVGYGADPGACLALARERCSLILLGNHDEAAVEPDRAMYFNPVARAAVEWTHEQLTSDERSVLSDLPLTQVHGPLFCVHASPNNPAEWEYIFDEADAREAFAHFRERICCIGHTHVADLYPEPASKRADPTVRRYLVNVGSVGQPRDRDPRAAWCLIETEKPDIEFRRVVYDIETAASKIRSAGLPSALAERLFRGM